MLVKLIEVHSPAPYSNLNESQRVFSLREVFVNPNHVVCLREDNIVKEEIKNSELRESLDTRQEYTKIFIDRGQSGIDITVVGSLVLIEEKLSATAKTLLKG